MGDDISVATFASRFCTLHEHAPFCLLSVTMAEVKGEKEGRGTEGEETHLLHCSIEERHRIHSLGWQGFRWFYQILFLSSILLFLIRVIIIIIYFFLASLAFKILFLFVSNILKN